MMYSSRLRIYLRHAHSGVRKVTWWTASHRALSVACACAVLRKTPPRVCGSISPAAARHSLHSITLWGVFINIPISGVPDCSICRNKLGIVFDIRSENTPTRGGTQIWIHVHGTYWDLVNEPSQGHYFSASYSNGFTQQWHLVYRFHIAFQKTTCGELPVFPKW